MVLLVSGLGEKGEQWEWFGGIGVVKRVNARIILKGGGLG